MENKISTDEAKATALKNEEKQGEQIKNLVR